MVRLKLNRETARSTEEDYPETEELHREPIPLVRELAEIDEQLESGDAGTDRSAAQRWAMISAVDTVRRFLRSEGASCKVLDQLWFDLFRRGVTSGALTAEKPRAGRRRDSPEVLQLKGRIAGIARLRMAAGQSRDDAASWVARKIPHAVASRLSSKPIKASTVKEWMDQYDCKAKVLDMFASNDWRKEFESWAFEDDGSIECRARKIGFFRDIVPENKRRNHIPGFQGFMMQLYIACVWFAERHAEGYEPNFDPLFAELEDCAVELIPDDPSEASDS